MLTHDGLKRDVARRIARIQAMMRDQDIGALILAGHASPSGMGAIRYITHAHLWGGVGYAILGVDDPHPWLQIWSSYQAVWSRNETTTLKERVECPLDVVGRTAELAMEYVGGSGRIGMVNMDKLMPVGTVRQFEAALPGCELVEVTNDFNVIRQIKTPFELEAMQQNGSILDAAMDVFAEYAEPGVRYWDVCAEVERYIKSFGAFWGRTKLSTNLSPETVPTDKDQRISADDIINFEIVYESPWGYWLEMTTVCSFGPLPDEVQALLDGYLYAVECSSAVAKTGNTLGMIADANDEAMRSLGFEVVGKHTPDCHSTGLDGSDGPSDQADPNFELKSNMTLSFHPGSITPNNRGFLISDNFLVTPEGAVRLSPHNASRYHMLLENA
jgi:Xaa-Pro aminopeptidase